MVYPYSVKQLEQNKFQRIFHYTVDVETYISSWNEIFKMLNRNNDTIYVVTDYTDCQILIEEQDFLHLANYLRSELDISHKLYCSVIVNTDHNYTKMILWKDDYILHGIYLKGKIFTDEKSAFEFIGISNFYVSDYKNKVSASGDVKGF